MVIYGYSQGPGTDTDVSASSVNSTFCATIDKAARTSVLFFVVVIKRK